MSTTRSLPSVFHQAAGEGSTPVLLSEPRSEPIIINRNIFAREPLHMFDSDGSDDDADMPMPQPHTPTPQIPEPGSPRESPELSGVSPIWCHVTREHPERIEAVMARYPKAQAQSDGTPDNTFEDMPTSPKSCPGCSTSTSGDVCSGCGPTPVEDDEDEKDHADSLMFQWDNDEPEQLGPSATSALCSSGSQPTRPPFAERQGFDLDRSALFSRPVTETSTAIAQGVFTMPHNTGYGSSSSPAAIGSASGAHHGTATREAGHHNPVQLTPNSHGHGANVNTGVQPESPPPPYPPILKYPRVPVSPAPPYMPLQDQSGQPLSSLENSAMNTGTVVRFTAYTRSLCPPIANPNYWILFFDALIKMLVYMMRQSPHLASFWTLIIFSCLMVAHELGCRRRLLRFTWSRIMRLRGFRWEYTRRSKISIVDLCRARVLQLVADELAVNRFLNMQRIKSTGYMVFDQEPVEANATSCWPSTNMPLSFLFRAEIPQLVFELMGGQFGLQSYENVCHVLRVSHLLIHPPPTFPFPAPTPPVQDHPGGDEWA